MTSLASLLSRPSAPISSGSPLSSPYQAVAELWRQLATSFPGWYRPELHYMRGPGPRWRAKRGIAGGGAARPHDGRSHLTPALCMTSQLARLATIMAGRTPTLLQRNQLGEPA